MTPVVSRDAFEDALRELLRVEPGLYAESVQLFYREHAPYEPRRVFDYLFIAEDAPAVGTLKGSNIYKLNGDLVGHFSDARGKEKRLDKTTDKLFPEG